MLKFLEIKTDKLLRGENKMRVKKVKLSAKDYNTYFDVMRQLGYEEFTSCKNYNLDFFRLVFQNESLIKRVTKKVESLKCLKKGTAIQFEKKNYLVRRQYITYSSPKEIVQMGEVETMCGVRITEINKIKVLK